MFVDNYSPNTCQSNFQSYHEAINLYLQQLLASNWPEIRERAVKADT